MHTPLDAHLHTAECNQIISQLLACHAERSKVAQLFGACNDLDTLMRRCTKQERLARAEANRKSAIERQEKQSEMLRRRKETGEKSIFEELLTK